LESGVYTKTESGAYYVNGCFCALGVLYYITGSRDVDGRLMTECGYYRFHPEFKLLKSEQEWKRISLANDCNKGDNFKAVIEAIKDLQTTN
jgi:hypothetical protein